MKRNCLVLIFLFMLLLTASALGAHPCDTLTLPIDTTFHADVSMRINGALPNLIPGPPQMYVGQDNTLEFWFTNNQKLIAWTLGFEFINSGSEPFSIVVPWGNLPYADDGGDPPVIDSSNCFLNEYGLNASQGGFRKSWGLGGLALDNAGFPDQMTMAGIDILKDQSKHIWKHLSSTIAYSIKVRIPALQVDGTFCVKPKKIGAMDFIIEAGTQFLTPLVVGTTRDTLWATNFFANLPTFQGLPIGASDNPQGEACFVRGVMPCMGPIFTATPAASVSHSHGSPYTFTFQASDPNNPPMNPVTFTAVGGTIGLNSGALSVDGVCPSQVPTHVVVTAHNTCPGGTTHTDYPFDINWTNANPVITNCPSAPVIATLNNLYQRTFTATDTDLGDVASLTWNATSLDANGTFGFVGNVFSYTPTATGTDHFTITATDVCSGVSVPCELVINAVAYDMVKIPKLEMVYQGTYQHVPVLLTGSALSLAGYNLLIHYDASALSFVSAEIGDKLKPCPLGGSGWEYFTYRFGYEGNCNGPCPSGLLRLVALAETNNGPNHPGCGGAKDPFNAYGEIADLKFYVTNDRTFECQYSEIGFAWVVCSDNTFSDPTGNILYLSGVNAVHTFEWTESMPLDTFDIPCTHYPIVTPDAGIVYGGFCVPDCQAYDNKPVEEVLYFWNGGVDIACADSIDARGDVNLNGIANEIADAVVFTNFFLKGITAFTINVQGQVAATDVNNDGRPLTVGDLVYLLRIIVGDALPFTKLSPFASAATVNFVNGSVSTVSGSEIGAVYATFAINGAYNVVSNTNMQVDPAEVNGELKVLVYSGMSNLSNRIASGTNELFTVSGDVELKSVEVADYYGNMLNARVNKISLPTSFALSQNVPNPFNPTTKLGFALPNQTEWTLSIYNVAGQLVKNFSGNNIGNVSVEWDASMAPSGVYFYKLNAGSYSDTKKMVLMK